MGLGNYREKLVSRERADALVHSGYKKFDSHVHTSKSHDVLYGRTVKPEVVYQKALDKGMGIVFITDHDTIGAHEELGERPNLVTGVEVTLNDKDIGHEVHSNVYGLSKAQFCDIDGIRKENKIGNFLSYVRQNNLYHTLNHALWAPAGKKLCERSVPYLIQEFPIIELNEHRIPFQNRLVMKLAEKYKKPVIAASDTHTGGVGRAYTLAKGDNFKECFGNVMKGDAYLVSRGLTSDLLKNDMVEWIGMAFDPEARRPDLGLHIGYEYVDRLVGAAMRGKFDSYRMLMENTAKLLSKTVAPYAFLAMESYNSWNVGRELVTNERI